MHVSLCKCFGSTLVKIAIDDKNKLIYLDEKFHAVKQSSDDIVSVCSEFVGTNDIVVCDYSDNSKINDLRANGINAIPCEKGADSIRKGIKDMLDYKLIVTPTSINLKRELNRYIWNDKKAGIPLKGNDHIIDGARYGFQYLNKTKK